MCRAAFKSEIGAAGQGKKYFPGTKKCMQNNIISILSGRSNRKFPIYKTNRQIQDPCKKKPLCTKRTSLSEKPYKSFEYFRLFVYLLRMPIEV